MDPTRVGQFDNEMYLEHATEVDRSLEESLLESILNWIYRDEEQRIADSHDITKSNFGFTCK